MAYWKCNACGGRREEKYYKEHAFGADIKTQEIRRCDKCGMVAHTATK